MFQHCAWVTLGIPCPISLPVLIAGESDISALLVGGILALQLQA